jgi:hypothetical protein
MTDPAPNATVHAQLIQLSMEKLTEAYVTAREHRAVLQHELETKLEKFDAVMGQLSNAMLAKLTAEGVTSAPNEFGTPYIYPNVTGNIVDFEQLWKFMIAYDRPDLLHKRLTLTAVTEWNETNPDKPVPGVQLATVNQVRVTAPKKRKH